MAKKKGRRPAPKPKRRPLKPVKRRVLTQKATPARPGVLAPGASPFLSGDQMIEGAEQEAGWRTDLEGLGEDLTTLETALPQSLDQIARVSANAREGANASAIERGIFQSSIRDMAIQDIGAQEASQTANARGLVESARRAYGNRQRQIEGAGGERERFNLGQLTRAAENARAVNESRQSPYSQEPVAAAAAKYKTVKDYAPGTPGIQGRAQALQIRRNRSKAAHPRRPQPGRPGKPRRTRPQSPYGRL
jgi:hypothetical protein